MIQNFSAGHSMRWLYSKTIQAIAPKYFRYGLIRLFSRAMAANTAEVFYYEKGVLQYHNAAESGEKYLIEQFLPQIFDINTKLVIFDVGANTGRIALSLGKTFPKAEIYAFEPNPKTFIELERNAVSRNIVCHAKGLSDKQGMLDIFSSSNEIESEHTCLYPEVLSHFHQYDDIESYSVVIDTIDCFCSQKSIPHIDFLKIDTEGHELSVLIGAKQMLGSNKIDIILFEFNEMNVISRTFWRDFFNLLSPRYNLFRVHGYRLSPITKYDPKDEVFLFQNYIAIRKELRSKSAQ